MPTPIPRSPPYSTKTATAPAADNLSTLVACFAYGATITSPATTVASFSHHDEHASPGLYQVELGQQAPISVSLSVTTRSGISSFAFPPGTESNVLFKVADSSNPVTAANVQVLGHDEVEGQVSSGQFCGTGTNYTVKVIGYDATVAWCGAAGNICNRRCPRASARWPRF